MKEEEQIVIRIKIKINEELTIEKEFRRIRPMTWLIDNVKVSTSAAQLLEQRYYGVEIQDEDILKRL